MLKTHDLMLCPKSRYHKGDLAVYHLVADSLPLLDNFAVSQNIYNRFSAVQPKLHGNDRLHMVDEDDQEELY